jgi:hypothetical protein
LSSNHSSKLLSSICLLRNLEFSLHLFSK